MADILLLRLEGPMQSWGTRSRWDVRDTGPDPSKSGVIGLLGCALGLRRGDPDLLMLDRELSFALRNDIPGSIGVDYHTISGYHRTADGGFRYGGGTNSITSLAKASTHDEYTVVSQREYIDDASFLVALTSEDPTILQCLSGESTERGWHGSLRTPEWPVYLGRRSCVPTRPILDKLTDEYSDLESALRQAPWEVSSPKALMPQSLEGWIEDREGSSERQDAIRHNQMRFYGFTRYRRIEVDTSRLRRSP